jgi:Cu(I)/Ag(I) efflux system membrane protein CusA/SilA
MFTPLAYTKTYAMAVAAGLSITLVPVLMGYFVRGKIFPEHKNPLNRLITWIYMPVIKTVLEGPKTMILIALVILAIGLWPATRIGSEFMPPLDEGDLMYMPTTYPGISIGKARELLQQTDKLIKTLPEVDSVFGKIGRADSATDPAPLTMIETLIQLKPKSQWRPGVTTESLRAELDSLVKFPGLTNAWVMPIKTRIDMLATGIKTPVGIKVAGPKLSEIETIGKQLETILKDIPGTASVYSERVAGGRYIKADIDRDKAARFGLNISDVQNVIKTAIGGMSVSQTVEGLERYPINIRYPQSYRDSVEKIRLLPLTTKNNQRIALSDVADIRVEDGPPAIKSENARLNGWTLVDISNRDLGSYVAEAQRVVAEKLDLPTGYSIAWSGQYEYLVRAKQRLSIVVPLTLGIIMLLLYINFRNLVEVLIIMGTLPFALIGGIWLMYILDYEMSVAVGVGFIALAGVTVEIGVLMLVYLNLAFTRTLQQALNENRELSRDEIRSAVIEGAGRRVRPIMMTFAAIVVGLIPIMLGEGTGSEVMQRIAGPMIGGMVSSLVLTLLVIPAIYFLWKSNTVMKPLLQLSQQEA